MYRFTRFCGGFEDDGVDVHQGDFPIACRPAANPIDDNSLGEHGAARADEDQLLFVVLASRSLCQAGHERAQRTQSE